MSLPGTLNYPSVNLAQLATKPVPAQRSIFRYALMKIFLFKHPAFSAK